MVVVLGEFSAGVTTGARSSMHNLRTERSWRNDLMRHARPASWRRRDYLCGILPRIRVPETQKCDGHHCRHVQNIFTRRKSSPGKKSAVSLPNDNLRDPPAHGIIVKS